MLSRRLPRTATSTGFQCLDPQACAALFALTLAIWARAAAIFTSDSLLIRPSIGRMLTIPLSGVKRAYIHSGQQTRMDRQCAFICSSVRKSIRPGVIEAEGQPILSPQKSIQVGFSTVRPDSL